nr:hypothetical protein [Tanacetum cinerariifolium]
PFIFDFLLSEVVSVGRGGARKGGSWVLTPDLVVMATVSASGTVVLIEPQNGRIIVDVSP